MSILNSIIFDIKESDDHATSSKISFNQICGNN